MNVGPYHAYSTSVFHIKFLEKNTQKIEHPEAPGSWSILSFHPFSHLLVVKLTFFDILALVTT
jgi:hypothetical protein